MDNIYLRGKLKLYYLTPLYLMGVFFLCSFGLFLYDQKLACILTAITGIAWLVILIILWVSKRRLEQEMISFATQYGTVQRSLLEHFQLPYALMDAGGKLLWLNERFCELTGKARNYRKSVTSIFSEITRESLDRQEADSFEYSVRYNDRAYRVLVSRLYFDLEDRPDAMIRIEAEASQLFSCMVFDETELIRLRRENEEQKLVTGLVYIDNYEETLDAVEDKKRSLLTAVIDRKVNNYFEKADGLVRKLDKDRFFVAFQSRYLKKLEEDRFSLLEDIKHTKAAGDNDVTLSIGIGAGAENYQRLAEYAKTAIGLAMGRGGSQAVVKSGADVSYYGLKGKEVDKSSRVKARVKAQALREMMATKDKVICMGHKISDVDALGAAIGIFCAAREMDKECMIVINTVTTSLRPFVDLFSEEKGYPQELFVDSYEALDEVTSNTLVVVVDTNRPGMVECPELLTKSRNIVVFDHHMQGKDQIKNPLLSYVEPYASSACEMIAEVLQYFSDKIHLAPAEADCIYGGILIDTNNYMTKTGVRTFEAAAYLRRCGADVTRVRKLLRENMDAYKARAEVVRNAEVYRSAFAISLCAPGELESPTIVAAQAANELLNIVGIKASFVLTRFNGKIFISARSIDEIDVQSIMERLGGGGHLNVAGAQLDDDKPGVVKEKIRLTLDDMIAKGEIVL